MHNTLRLLQPIPLLQLTALLQAIQLVDILQPLMAGRAMATAQDHPTSCAKLSGRARLVTVAPTLSPMPNGKPLSGASGTAEFASLAIAFRRTDYWLKPPRRNASARSCLRASRTTREVRGRRFVPSGRLHRAPTKCSNKERDGENFAPKISRRGEKEGERLRLFIGRWPT